MMPAAAERMSETRAATALPTTLSFARSAMRLLVRGRWRVEKVHVDLDSDGRGEVLYRLHGAARTFHFFLVSDKLREALKTDRNFAAGWDAMGVLCEGDWTPEREALMRCEVPKQRAGFADYDTLAYARGNRSARLFDAMVEQLAAGGQPDPRLVAPVGYVLRTTAFIANGQLGTRPLAGYPADHPLRRPYHAQFVSAFLLREFVFDLVDHLARVRDPRAVRLAPAHRRYLGIGNSAATGLVHYVANHPRQLQGWLGTVERTLAIARARSAVPGSPQSRRGLALLDRAIVHARDGRRPPDGVFKAVEAAIPALQRVRDALAAYDETGRLHGQATDTPWLTLAARTAAADSDGAADRSADPGEATTTSALAGAVLDAIVLELHEDLVAAAEDRLAVDEGLEVDPSMTVSEIAMRIDRDYDWTLAGANEPDSERHFWYRTTSTPRDIRRGLRGRRSADEHETTLDTVRQARVLRRVLALRDPAEPVARLLFERPDLRQIVARIRTLAGEPYAEVRVEPLAAGFSPFAPIRLVLALFGLEKFEAAPPKSVRGTFLQGAPIAEDVAAGRDGTWPFPTMPGDGADSDDADTTRLNPPPRGLGIAAPPAAPIDTKVTDPRTERRIAPGELNRMVRMALQAGGASLGDADAAARIAVQDHLLGGESLEALLRDSDRRLVARRPGCRIATRGGHHPAMVSRASSREIVAPFAGAVEIRVEVIEADGGAAWVLGPAACDLAVALACHGPLGLGVVVVRDATASVHMGPLAWRAAGFGCHAVVLWRSTSSADLADAVGGFAAAGSGPDGWFVHAFCTDGPDALVGRCREADRRADVGALASALRVAIAAFGHLGDGAGGFVVACVRRSDGDDVDDAAVQEALAAIDPTVRRWPRGGYTDWLGDADRRGVTVPRALFDRLDAAGRALLLPTEYEASVLPPGADPLKHF